MFYLDNSEFSWLVYADWLEDQDIDATHIRQEVLNPTTNQTIYEHYYISVGAGGTVCGQRICPSYDFDGVGGGEININDIGGCGDMEGVGCGERFSNIGGFNGY